MKFTSAGKDLGPLRSYTLPAAKWEIVRRALGVAGLGLSRIIGETFNDTQAPVSYVGTCVLPIMSRDDQAAYREAAEEYLKEFAPVEQEIQVGGTINYNWEVLAVGEDWATCRDTSDGEVALWYPGEVYVYTPKAPEHRLYGEPYPAEVIGTDGHDFPLGSVVTVYPDGTLVPPCTHPTIDLKQYLDHHQLRPL